VSPQIPVLFRRKYPQPKKAVFPFIMARFHADVKRFS